MTIHREGKATLTISIIFLSIVVGTVYRMVDSPLIFNLVLAVSVLLFLIVLQFFRDPGRKIKQPDSSKVYAPADGKIVVIEDAIEHEYFKDERLMISIFMSPINVHINFNPIGGAVSYSKYHPGKYLAAWNPKASTENERMTTVYKTGDVEVLTRQIAGALARRIVNYLKKGDEVKQGDEMGFIKFGSRVDIFLPVGTKYNVKMGQKVTANVDVIAEI